MSDERCGHIACGRLPRKFIFVSRYIPHDGGLESERGDELPHKREKCITNEKDPYKVEVLRGISPSTV